jgi:DNA-binding transcriptional ArsR family regulator
MVKRSSASSAAASLDAAFAALADPTRRAIVARLASAERSVGELAKPLPMSLPAVSRHLRILEGAGLVARRKEGRTHVLRLVPQALEPAQDWIARHRAFWTSRLDALERYLAIEAAPPAPKRRRRTRN